ncbi:hypothetical protein B2J93_4321 [Marssonina coronariae]|uniref:Uncharacterized protein n=1 Tax=Diplocarpon coronariae TaxID=2795749 RepID=A0A218ZF33_9HELO|nr:hypothetical protein B2J93_4321 [Marssonina coronariae]
MSIISINFAILWARRYRRREGLTPRACAAVERQDSVLITGTRNIDGGDDTKEPEFGCQNPHLLLAKLRDGSGQGKGRAYAIMRMSENCIMPLVSLQTKLGLGGIRLKMR